MILAKDDALCKSSVDFPIPGSPPSKIAERFVAPPPRTLSNSSIPVENLTLFSVFTDSRETGFFFSTCSVPRPAGVTAFLSMMISSRVFHSLHSGHLPSHFGCEYPHDEHL